MRWASKRRGYEALISLNPTAFLLLLARLRARDVGAVAGGLSSPTVLHLKHVLHILSHRFRAGVRTTRTVSDCERVREIERAIDFFHVLVFADKKIPQR